jgi:hypothetical protein
MSLKRVLELAVQVGGEGSAGELRALATSMLRPDFTGLSPCQRKVAAAMHEYWLARGSWPTLKELAERLHANHYTRGVDRHRRELIRLGAAVSDNPKMGNGKGGPARCVRLVFRGE